MKPTTFSTDKFFRYLLNYYDHVGNNYSEIRFTKILNRYYYFLNFVLHFTNYWKRKT